MTSRREDKKRQVRIELVRVAIELFEQQGFDATTVDDIAAAAGCGRATFFRYFGTKEDVAFGDVAERVARLHDVLRRPGSPADPWATAKNTVSGLIADLVILSNELGPSCLRLWFSEPALQRRYAEITLRAEHEIGRFLADGWGVDYATSVECGVLASALVGLSRTAVRAQALEGVSLTQALNDGFDLLEQGLLARARPEWRREQVV